MSETLLTTKSAALRLGVVGETVRLWERTGRLPAIRTESGQRLFRLGDVERLAAQRQRETARRRGDG